MGLDPFVSEAPVQIVVCTSEKVYKDRYREPDKKPDPEAEEQEWPVPYWHTDAGMALVLILLAAVNEGLAGAFVGVWQQPELQQLLGIPEDFLPIGVAMIGQPISERTRIASSSTYALPSNIRVSFSSASLVPNAVRV